MVRFPAEWRTAFGVGLVTAFPPDLGARFRWYERLVPQPTFSAIVERVLATDPDFRVHQIGDTVRAVTHEGEYAAWVPVGGRRQGADAVRYIGAVFVDHFASALDCVAIVPTHFERLRQMSFDLLRTARSGLTARPRRFYYVAPAGWQALPGGDADTWYPPDFPDNLSNLAVPHAVTLTSPPDAAVETAGLELGSGLTIEHQERGEITTPTGVRGTLFQVVGTRAGRDESILRELAIFVVGERLYQVRLETVRADLIDGLREQFRQVVASIRMLPGADEMRLGYAFTSRSTDFDHWVS